MWWRTWVQGSRVFCCRPRRRSAPKLVLANNEPVSFRGVFASACLFKRRFAPQETSAARHGGFERQAVCQQQDGRFLRCLIVAICLRTPACRELWAGEVEKC